VIVDVGTGSGCIAVTLARELNRSRVIATDISEAALMVAKRNALRHGMYGRVTLIAGDLLSAFTEEPFADLIISNPPYVSRHQVKTLQREVRDWEPHLALTDFGDGLSFYRHLLDTVPSRLKPGGHLICEMGYTQSAEILTMIEISRLGEPKFLDDLQGIPRTLVLKKTE
jgi:release factor glutamine methyltransferase